jgi:hypothetical protein
MDGVIMADENYRDGVSGGAIAVGNVDRSVVAIGAGAQVIYTNVERALTEVEIVEQAEAFERKRLAEAVTEYVAGLQGQAEQAQRRGGSGNPFKALLEYDFGDAQLFFGRDAAIGALLERLERSPLAVLHADSGMGKTSLLRAGLAPLLLARGHVPLYVRPYDVLIPLAIKRELITQLEQVPNLAAASLRDFLRRATGLLGGQRLVILLDQFEDVFAVQSAGARADFAAELAECLNDALLPVRWVLSLRGEWFGHLSTFQPQVPQPFANQFLLSALSRDEAVDTITRTMERSTLTIEPELIDRIVDDLGPDAIAPPQLQVVCHALGEGLSRSRFRSDDSLAPVAQRSGVSRLNQSATKVATTSQCLTVDAYVKIGRSEGILRRYLDDTLSRSLRPADRTPAWQALAAVAEQPASSAAESELVAHLKTYGVGEADTRRVLRLLETNRLLRVSGERYRLVSAGLLPRIRQWAAERSARELARGEVVRQIKRIRGSALRGAFGGALGFSLAYLLTTGTQIINPSLLGYTTLYRALPGAAAGLLLIFCVDVALASYHGPRRWMRWPMGGAMGAITFALAVLFHAMLRAEGRSLALPLAAAEGAVWGLVAGVGTVWVMSADRTPARTLLAVISVALAGGLALWLADHVTAAEAFGRPPSALLIGAAGAVMPLCVLVTALFIDFRKDVAP